MGAVAKMVTAPAPPDNDKSTSFATHSFVPCSAEETEDEWTSIARHGPLLIDATVLATVITFVLCGILAAIARNNGETWFDGFAAPPLSLTGRDPPQYFVFAVVLSMTAICFFGIFLLYCVWVRHLYLCTRVKLTCCSRCCLCCFGNKIQWAQSLAGLACINLVAMALSNYRLSDKHPVLLRIHIWSTIAMFVFSGAAMYLLSQLLADVLQALPEESSALGTSLAETISMKGRYGWLFIVAAALHIIPGYFVIPSTIADVPILSMEKCLEEGLKQEYCDYYQDDLKHNMTVLEDLSGYPRVVYSSLSQYVLITVLLGYVWLLRFDFRFWRCEEDLQVEPPTALIVESEISWELPAERRCC